MMAIVIGSLEIQGLISKSEETDSVAGGKVGS